MEREREGGRRGEEGKGEQKRQYSAFKYLLFL